MRSRNSRKAARRSRAGISATVSDAAAGERAGTYDVTIRRPGYSSFSQTGVVVTKNECHVNPVRLEARLTRSP